MVRPSAGIERAARELVEDSAATPTARRSSNARTVIIVPVPRAAGGARHPEFMERQQRTRPDLTGRSAAPAARAASTEARQHPQRTRTYPQRTTTQHAHYRTLRPGRPASGLFAETPAQPCHSLAPQLPDRRDLGRGGAGEAHGHTPQLSSTARHRLRHPRYRSAIDGVPRSAPRGGG